MVKERKRVREFPRSTPLDLRTSVREYWLERVARHKRDSYAGVRLAKFPEDLRVDEHLIWASKPNVVIEIGTLRGGSALWFRDRLRTLAAYGHIGGPLGMLVASQLVFVHIPRTGGAFIKGVLRDHLDQDTRVPRLPAHASYDEIPRSGKPQPPRRRSSLTSVENGQAGVVPGD